MRVSVVLEHRFDITPDGKVWTVTQFPYSFWCRYLDVFESVTVVARVRPINVAGEKSVEVTGRNVSFRSLPYYLGPVGFLMNFFQLRKVLSDIVKEPGALILRIPSALALSIPKNLLFKRSYSVEVVADPWDIFAVGAIRHPLRIFFRWWFTRGMKQQIAACDVASYVTKFTLQRRYPARREYSFSDAEISPIKREYHFSSIELRLTETFHPRRTKCVREIITVGSLSNHYKGVDVLIDAVGYLASKGISLRLTVVGDGVVRAELEKQVAALNLANSVRFMGNVTAGEAVFKLLECSDLFILASRTEGLPRAMIEAMSRGLPCLGSDVGGIPELIDKGCRFPAGDARALACKIEEIYQNAAILESMSRKNLETASSYDEQQIVTSRRKYYNAVKEFESLSKNELKYF